MTENVCLWFHALCQRKHEDCKGCVIFWMNGGLKKKHLLRLVEIKEKNQ